MRTSSIAALAAAAALAAGLTPALAAPAGATPTTAPPTITSGGTGTPAANTVESLVQALRDDLGLTPEQFLAQASVGERLSRAQQTWAKQFRKGFGGAWLDTAGRGTVGVAPGADAAALRKAATGAGFTVRDVALTTDQLADIAIAVGSRTADSVRNCIEKGTYLSWAKTATDRALESPIEGLDTVLEKTPTILVNGVAYVGALDNPAELLQAVMSAESKAVYGTATHTPTPEATPTADPSATPDPATTETPAATPEPTTTP